MVQQSKILPLVIDKFPKIAHYTTLGGLEGILSTKKLWATHFRYLNDTSEMQHGKKYLIEVCKKIGGYDEDRLKEVFDRWFHLSPNKNDPEIFVTSFSGIPCDNPDLESDGLLSQWKGYGRDSGFAIIFDTKELNKSYSNSGKKCKIHIGANQESGCKECQITVFSHLFAPVLYEHNADMLLTHEEYFKILQSNCA